MQFGDFKALISPLVLPPAGPLLLALLAVLMIVGLKRAPRVRRVAWGLVLVSLLALWLLSCHAVALRLTGWLLPLPSPSMQSTMALRTPLGATSSQLNSSSCWLSFSSARAAMCTWPP